MTLENLKALLREKGASEFLYKRLSDNDNSKQQIYLGGSYEVLQMLPYGDIYAEEGSSRPTFKAPLKLFWISDDGRICPAENAKLILYPKYPEIRLSGFLKGCKNAPRDYLQPKKQYERTGKHDGRVLILCPIDKVIFAYLATPGSSISNSLFYNLYEGVFGKELLEEEDTRNTLLKVLRKAYKENPHDTVRINSNGLVIPYTGKNAAGYTLEAQFGITPNGNPVPDYNRNIRSMLSIKG